MDARPQILVTNDDGQDSPIFAHTVEALRACGDLTIAVPATEQSWRGKSMTRVGRVEVQTTTVNGLAAYAISGTPADCVSIAIHNLMEHKPDVVVSGANIGSNTGLGFLLSSGTVGACLEGNIAGVPGLALSQQLEPAVFSQWTRHRAFDTQTLVYLKSLTDRLIPQVWQELAPHKMADAITLNVNFPYELADSVIERTFLGHSFYRRCFQQHEGGAYFHQVDPFERDPHPRSDNAVVGSGRVSVTKLDIRTLGSDLES